MITAIYSCKHHRCIFSFNSHNNLMDSRLEILCSQKKKGQIVYSVFCSWFEKITGAVCLKPEFVAWCSTSDAGNSLAASSTRLGSATLGLQWTYHWHCFSDIVIFFQSLVSTSDIWYYSLQVSSVSAGVVMMLVWSWEMKLLTLLN